VHFVGLFLSSLLKTHGPKNKQKQKKSTASAPLLWKTRCISCKEKTAWSCLENCCLFGKSFATHT